ncbi:MAG: PAS domain S-box protein, partial [Dehalococcoidia bacterium]
MEDQSMDREHLIDELDRLRRRTAELEAVVAERVKIDEVLRRSEERFRALVESASDVTVVLGSQGNIIYLSPNFEKVWGFKAEGVLGQDLFKNVHPDDIPMIGKNFADIIKNPKTLVRMQIRALYPDATWHTLDAEARNHLDDPAIGGIVVNFHDVTELKQAQGELKKVNEWFEEIIGLSKTNIDVIDSEFNLRYVDPEWQKVYGDPAGRKCYEYFRGQKEACRDCAIPDTFRTHQTSVAEHVLPRENNRIVEVHTIPFQSADGEWLVSELNIDITERKRMEGALEGKERYFRSLIENSSDGIMVLDRSGKILYESASCSRLLGYSEGERIGQVVFDPIHPDDMHVLIDGMKRIDSDVVGRSEVRARHKDGSWHSFEVSATSFLDDPAVGGVVVNLRDITERREAEAALKERDQLFKKLANNVPGMIYQFLRRPDGTYCAPFSTDSIKDILGCSPEDVRDDFSPVTRVVLPEDLGRLVESIEYSAEHMTPWQCEYRVQVPGKPVSWLLGQSTPEKLADGSVIWHGFNTDITERKRMEYALRESEEKYSTLVENATDGVSVIQDQALKFVNERMSEMSGYTVEELTGMSTFDLVPPDFTPVLKERFRLRAEGKEVPGIFETRMLCKDGTVKEMESSTKLIQYEGKPAVIAITRDVTERRRMEEALRESEDKYSTLVENAIECVTINRDEDKRIVFANKRMSEVSGYSIEELLGMTIIDLIPPDFFPVLRERFRMRMEGQEIPDILETRLLCKDGTIKELETSTRLIEYRGSPAVMSITRDFTERRRMEEALRASEEKYRLLAENASDVIMLMDMNARAVYFSPSVTRLLGYSVEEALAGTMDDRMTPASMEKAVKHFMAGLHRERRKPGGSAGQTLELEMIHKNGSIVIVEMMVSFIRDENGKPTGMMAILRDITDRKKTETRIIELSNAFMATLDPVLIIDMQGKVVNANEAARKLFERDDVGVNALETVAPEDKERVAAALQELITSGQPAVARYNIVTRSGRRVPLESSGSLILDANGKPVGIVVVARDLTERRQAEAHQKLAAEILGILNEPLALPDAINRILTAIKRETGFYAVGIRLKKDEDFPYFVQNGFSDDFLLTENTIVVRDSHGGICRDKDGNVSLECTCGLVLSGKTDPSNPLFTPGGSAWTNDSPALLDVPLEEDPRHHPRNRCIHAGFQSVALMPIRSGNEIIGLLQLNDRRKGCFTLEMIRFFEGIAASIGVALMRKQTEEALRESEERLRVTLEVTQIGVWEWNVEDDIWYASPTYYTMLGYEPVIGPSDRKVWLKRGHPDDVEMVTNKIKDVLNGVRDSYSYEARIRHADGSFRWNRVIGHTIEADAEGKPIRLAGVRVDITERKQAEEALRESEEKYKDLFEHTLLGMEVVDGETGKILLANHSMARMFEFKSPEEMVGINAIREHILPEDMDWVLDQFAQSMADPDRKEVATIRAKTVNGRLIWVAGSTTSYEYEGKPAALISLIEVTAAKEAEEALRESEEKFRNLAEQSPNMIFINVKGHVVYANRRCEEMMGYTSEEFYSPAFDFNSLTAPEYRDLIKEKFQAHMQGRDVDPYEYALITKDGRRLDTILSTKLISYVGEKAIMGIITDITERKKVEETLLRINKAVEGSSDAIGISDAQGHHFYHNRAFTELFEYTPEELEAAGGGPAAFANKHVARKVFDTIMGGGSWFGEVEMVSKSGRRFIVLERADAIKDEKGKVIGLVGVHTDITERKKAEEKLRETRDYMENLIEHA